MNTKLQPSTTYRAVLGKVLELQRKGLGWNQEEMAKRLNVSQSAWSRVETGQSSLSVEELAVVTHLLRTRPEDVLRDVHRSIEHLRNRGVQVLIGQQSKAEDSSSAAVLGAAALGALLLAVLAAGK